MDFEVAVVDKLLLAALALEPLTHLWTENNVCALRETRVTDLGGDYPNPQLFKKKPGSDSN